jgi:hypothetical protein
VIYLRRRLAAFLSLGGLTAGLGDTYGMRAVPLPTLTTSGSNNTSGGKPASEQAMDDFSLSF